MPGLRLAPLHGRLPPDEKDRTMLVMKEVGGFTVEEIGDILSLNVNTVKVRLFRGRDMLKRKLEAFGFGEKI